MLIGDAQLLHPFDWQRPSRIVGQRIRAHHVRVPQALEVSEIVNPEGRPEAGSRVDATAAAQEITPGFETAAPYLERLLPGQDHLDNALPVHQNFIAAFWV